jgi:hypothetical protein
MLLTNVTRSASYEALPNHRPFPAKSGLTSRFPLQNCCLWEEVDETAAIYFGKPKNTLEEGQKWGCCGSTELAIVVARRSWREISLWKTQQMKNSLNFVSTCLKVVDTRRVRCTSELLFLRLSQVVRLRVSTIYAESLSRTDDKTGAYPGC